MLGRLFGNANSSLSSSGYPRDSVVDEEYTRSLLYPDHTGPPDVATHVPQTGVGRVGDFDDWGGLELDASKDFRIILAQDALGDSEEPCILFDTHPSSQSENSADLVPRAGSIQTAIHRRGGSTTSSLRSPTSPFFPKSHQRISSNGPDMSFPMRNRSSTFSGASDEHDPRSLRMSDSKDETRTILNCAFGSSAGASSGTKMHVLSLGSGAKELPVTPSSPGMPSNMSAGYFRKREPIVRAHSSVLSGGRPALHEPSHSSSGTKPKFNDAVLITKLFSVNLPEPTESQVSQSSTTSPVGGAIEHQGEHSAHIPQPKGKKPRAKKTPVFAIILVVQLPPSLSTFSRPPSRGSMQSPPTHTSTRSFQSPSGSHSSCVNPMSLPTPFDHGDARVNALVEHWDIIDRTLNVLENVSAPKILAHLKQVDNFSAALVCKPSKPKEKTMQRTNQINIYLAFQALGSDLLIKETTAKAVHRIRRALRIPRVTIGQGRWGLWNDELIRIARFYGGKEQNFFILNLLTSFLGAHTAEWMTLLAPSWYRHRRPLRRKANDSDVTTTRTVVISNDRSIARRLIFLLSSFLVSDARSKNGSGLYSERGSSVSLRNAILNFPSLEASGTTQRSCSPERNQIASWNDSHGSLLISRGLQRKPSDIRSMKSIPIPAKDISVRKSSAATTSTITPNPTTPVPHFSSGSGPEAGYFPDESSASASLNKIWQSANKDSESSTASTKWGSLLSGFWSKDASADASESTAPSASSSIRAKKGTPLDAMVKELGLHESPEIPAQVSSSGVPVDDLPSKSLPVNLQVNADQGVIDVDIGIPGFLSSSNDSGLSSPPFRNIRHISSVASFDSVASPMRNFSPKGGGRLRGRVAGFLPSFHPDYSLQAVRVGKSDLPDLMEKIKSAMLSEPHSPESTTTGWVDVSTTLIANVQTASVKRLRMRRRVSRLGDHADKIVNSGVEQSTSPRPIERSSTTSSEFVQEEAFSYESVTEPDPVLTDAIERILARHNSHHSRSASPAPFSHSRQTSTGINGSRRRGNKQTTLRDSRSPDGLSRGLSGNMVVGALEDVVKSVNHDLTERASSPTLQARTKYRSPDLVRKAQDNALREGVRSWLLNVEHLPAVW
jgi:Folliculin-interacting protein N-terminus